MDREHFLSAYNSFNINEQLRIAALTEDYVGTILRVHLYLEHIIGVWVEAKAENKKILSGDLKLTFKQLLILASNFGLNKNIFLAIEKINTIRNRVSHNIEYTHPTENDISIIENHLNGLNFTLNNTSSSYKNSNYIINGVEKKHASLNEREKLLAITFFIMAFLVNEPTSIS